MQLERYKRQTLVKELGEQGQQQLAEKHVVIIGGGGLGSNSAEILVRMGVGSIVVIDDDPVDITNLHRTSIFTEADIGKAKSLILEGKLQMINTQVKVHGVTLKATKENIETLFEDADIILDGTDNLETRFLINDAAVKKHVPWVYAGVYGTMGMVMGILPEKTPCLCCIAQKIPEKQPETPVLGHLPLSIAAIQCTEALKILLEKPTAGFILYDVWKQTLDQIPIERNASCSCCVKHKYGYLEG